MMKFLNRVTLLSVCTLFSCNLIEYHPYDVDVTGPTGINERNMKLIETSCEGQDTIRFAVISDTQRWYDETQAAVRSINADPTIDFVVHCGDISDFGVTKEFMWMRDILQNLHVPYVCLIGNHDCLGTGEATFCRVFGKTNFSFTAGNNHFLCLNTNAFEFDYSVPIPDFGFMRTDCDSVAEHVTRTVVAMHAKPFTEQFNNNVVLPFQDELHKFPGLAFCICGHDHRFSIDEPFRDGIPYYECGAAKSRAYLVFTLTPEDYAYEEVHY